MHKNYVRVCHKILTIQAVIDIRVANLYKMGNETFCIITQKQEKRPPWDTSATILKSKKRIKRKFYQNVPFFFKK